MADDKPNNVVVNVLDVCPVRLNLLHLQVMDADSGQYRECWTVAYETTVQGKEIQVPIKTLFGLSDTAQHAMELAAARPTGFGF